MSFSSEEIEPVREETREIAPLPRSLVINLALVSEGALIIISVIWCVVRDISFPVELSRTPIIAGLVFTLPIVALNMFLFRFAPAALEARLRLTEFKHDIIFPLVAEINVPGAFILAISSGFAEELFFRGVLHTELVSFLGLPLAIIGTSFLFALIHFGGSALHYAGLMGVYFTIGVYLSLVAVCSGSLISAMVTHGAYNLFAILYIRYLSIPEEFPTRHGIDR